MQLHYEGEPAYLRGDFERTKDCFRRTEGDDASRLRASVIAIAAAISTGDYPLCLEIESFLKSIIQTTEYEDVKAFAELCLSTAYLSAVAPNMAPDWLKNGDFTHLHNVIKPDGVYKRGKYFQCLSKYEDMLLLAETALELCVPQQEISFHGIYFHVECATACCGLGRKDEAKRWLLDGLKIALPHGFITPFAEMMPFFGGLLEQILEQEYPEYCDVMVNQWNRTFVNWLDFHNHFTKDNITLILSLREYQMAILVARHVPYKEIAAQFHISIGRLNNIMRDIYSKLYVSNRDGLAKLLI